MPKYVTYMSIIFHTQGASPLELARIIKGLGWKPMYGDYDFVYEWDIDLEWKGGLFEFFCEVNELHERLKNLNVSYTLKTFEQGKGDSTAINCP